MLLELELLNNKKIKEQINLKYKLFHNQGTMTCYETVLCHSHSACFARLSNSLEKDFLRKCDCCICVCKNCNEEDTKY